MDTLRKSGVLLRKNGQNFVVIYNNNERGRAEATRTLGRYASNGHFGAREELRFTWRDTAMLTNTIAENATNYAIGDRQ